MGKRLFTILVAMILCLSLAACGQNNDPAPKVDDGNATMTDNADVGGENGESDTDPDEDNQLHIGLVDGSYEHRIGDAVFYTENDINQWINDGVFDFYGMMEYFGWTEKEFPNNENAYAALRSDGFISVKLRDDGDSTAFPHFSIDHDGGMDIVVDPHYGEILHLPSGMKISSALCELMLFSMENLSNAPDATKVNLSMIASSMPDEVLIAWN